MKTSTVPDGAIRPPPAGFEEMIFPFGISSLNSSALIFIAKPRSDSSFVACFNVAPAREGTTTFDPGPAAIYQAPTPRITARKATILQIGRAHV